MFYFEISFISYYEQSFRSSDVVFNLVDFHSLEEVITTPDILGQGVLVNSEKF